MGLSELERWLEKLIERDLPAILFDKELKRLLAQRLSEAIEEHREVDANGESTAPSDYEVLIPSTAPITASTEGLAAAVQTLVGTLAQEAGLHLKRELQVLVKTDPELRAGDLRILVPGEPSLTADTAAVKAQDAPAGQAAAFSANAYLILEGMKVHVLAEPITNIGRRLGNHLVLDDPRVSRSHAQIRWVRDRFVIFDLNSTGGTHVNGERIAQRDLHVGDVISLSGVSLVFGTDVASAEAGHSETAPSPATQIEDPTLVTAKRGQGRRFPSK